MSRRDTDRLARLAEAPALQAFPVDERVADAWTRLRVLLRDLGRRMPANDSWIAATALAYEVPIVTRDDDIVFVPGLEAIHV